MVNEVEVSHDEIRVSALDVLHTERSGLHVLIAVLLQSPSVVEVARDEVGASDIRTENRASAFIVDDAPIAH